jgi:hypothetical protein
MQLCVSVQIPICFEGLQSEAIYVDTNSNFSQLRLTGTYFTNKLFFYIYLDLITVILVLF